MRELFLAFIILVFTAGCAAQLSHTEDEKAWLRAKLKADAVKVYETAKPLAVNAAKAKIQEAQANGKITADEASAINQLLEGGK